MTDPRMRKAVVELAEALEKSESKAAALQSIASAWEISADILKKNFERKNGPIAKFSRRPSIQLGMHSSYIGRDFTLYGVEYIFLGIAPRDGDSIDTFRARRRSDGEEIEMSWGQHHERVRPQLESE